MDKFGGSIIRHKRMIVVLFIAAAAICALLTTFVKVNYNVVDYLPHNAQSTKALEIMQSEFGGNVANASVMIKGVTIPEAIEYKREIGDIEGVSSVMWLDDVVDI